VQLPVQSIYVDSDNDLCVGSQGKGLYRIAGQRVEHYAIRDGPSSDSINKISEDREGNVWVATREGLDRFRDVKVATVSARDGLSDDQVNELPGEEVTSMFEDRHGRMLVGVDKRLVRRSAFGSPVKQQMCNQPYQVFEVGSSQAFEP
jgi:ligand-binding sensor domain-containing protein